VRLVLARVCWVVAIGILMGTIVSLWTSRLIATLLYGVGPRDTTTLVAAATTLAIVGAVAGLPPADRASQVDPAEILRER
jgi:ABC-type antimicrobial peptide transport system permease subunit